MHIFSNYSKLLAVFIDSDNMDNIKTDWTVLKWEVLLFFFAISSCWI